MSQAENILLFDVIFSIMLVAFGGATGTVSLTAFQTIQSPQLASTPKQQIQNCQNTDAGCIASNLALATAYIGWAIVNLPVLVIFFAQLFILFANSVLEVVFSNSFSPNGVPFLGIFFAGLQLYIVWEVLRTIRGSSTGV
jgi:hypothetical protein